MRARSALSIQKDVIFALFVRELSSRFSTYAFGNVWIVLEPLLMMILFIVIFGLRGRGEFGFVEPAIFIFAAFLPFRLLWQSNMKKAMSAIGASRGLTGFRQVRLFDIFLVKTFMEAGLFIVVGLILGLGLFWIGLDPWPRNPMLLLFYCLLLWMFSTAFGILACMASQIAPEVAKFINMLTMPLLFLSAVFFPMTIVPQPFLTWLAWNPLAHAMELVREAWFVSYVSPIADVSYLGYWAIALLWLAIATYRVVWQRVVAS